MSFSFSQAVDPSTVNLGSVSVATASGELARGTFIVNGNVVEFIPDISVVGGVTQFGFRRNETYVLTMEGGEGSTGGVRSLSGDGIEETIRCSLSVTGGVIDFNQAPPTARLLQPSGSSGVGLNSAIIVEFDEIIDISSFQGATTATSPIQYQLKPTFLPAGATEPECDLSFPPITVEGVPQALVDSINNTTTVTLQPVLPLPKGTCCEVVVTAGVRDLSGRAANPITFRFLTEESTGQEFEVVESFQTSARQDADRSSGTWGNGEAVPGKLGGDGRHGVFDITVGNNLGNNVFEWDTTSITFPARITPTQQPITVTTGEYFFEEMILPVGFTLRIFGDNAPIFRVMGEVNIAGRIELNGQDMTVFAAKDTVNAALLPGQPGSVPGAGGGRGGTGGDRATGVGEIPSEAGQDGEDLQVRAGNAYLAQSVGTGGPGSSVWPPSGRNNSIVVTTSFVFSGQLQAGGGGGGFLAPGGTGRVTVVPPGANLAVHGGPPNSGGVLFDPFPIPVGTTSLDHFAIGGSGGGGGGSHCFLALPATQLDKWRAGAGGAGGGGSLVIRAGADLVISNTGAIECKGGNGVDFTAITLAGIPSQQSAYPAPGGGGSGGSVLLQTQANLLQAGSLDVSGGVASRVLGVFPTSVNGECEGGDGSYGLVRLESGAGGVNPGSVLPGATTPSTGTLTDTDDIVGDTSLWYSSGLVFPPQFLRYEISVDDGTGSITTYSDDPAFGLTANDPSLPVRFEIQGARVSALTGEADPDSIGPWRELVGGGPGVPALNRDSATGFRYRLVYNIKDFPNVKVTRVRLVFSD